MRVLAHLKVPPGKQLFCDIKVGNRYIKVGNRFYLKLVTTWTIKDP